MVLDCLLSHLSHASAPLMPGVKPPCFSPSFLTVTVLPTVNSVCWAPHDYGLLLACGSSDGAISLLSYSGEGQWEVKKINNAHTVSAVLSGSLQVFDAPPAFRGAGNNRLYLRSTQWKEISFFHTKFS